MTLLLGLQWLTMMTWSWVAANQFFETGFFGSVLLGVIPAMLLTGVLFAMFPRLFIGLFTLFWAAVGYQVVFSILGHDGEATFAAVLSGAVGYFANRKYHREIILPSYEEGQRDAQVRKARKAVSKPISVAQPTAGKLDLDGYDVDDLTGYLNEALKMRVLEWKDYDQAMKLLPKQIRKDYIPRGSMHALERKPMADTALSHLGVLWEAKLISDNVFQKGSNLIEGALYPGGDQDEVCRDAFEAERESSRAAALRDLEKAVNAGEIGHLAHNLFDLIRCRAIDIDTFKRVMPKVDPEFDISGVKEENFAYEYPPADAEQQAAELFQSRLISLEELDDARTNIAVLGSLA